MRKETHSHTYNPTIDYYKTKYKVDNLLVMGFIFGAWGTIPKFLSRLWKSMGLDKTTLLRLIIIAIRGSVSILRNHLYGYNNLYTSKSKTIFLFLQLIICMQLFVQSFPSTTRGYRWLSLAALACRLADYWVHILTLLPNTCYFSSASE